MRVLVCGGRTFEDFDMMHAVMWYCRDWLSVIIQGEAPGADTAAHVWGLWAGVPVESYPADWKRYGGDAGPIRNKQMLDEGKPDLVLAFPGGPGTRNMCKQAKARGVNVMYATSIYLNDGIPF